MKIEEIEQAIIEAERFILAAKEAINEQQNAPLVKICWGEDKGKLESPYRYDIAKGDLHQGQLAANVKRKSMDLTRSLSKMRKVKK